MQLVVRVFTLAFIILTTFSCSNGNKKYFAKKVANAYSGESLSTDEKGIWRSVPKRFDVPKRIMENQMIDEALGLETLRNGTKELEMRFWGGLEDSITLIVIKKQELKYVAHHFHFTYTMKDTKIDSVGYILDSISGYKEVLKEPKSGWKEFIAQLEVLGLWSMPDYFDVPGYTATLDTDEVGYTIELAKPNWYKMYTYAYPFSRVSKFLEAKRMVNILNYLNEEFDLNKANIKLP